MEYFGLVMQALGAAFGWFARVWTADEFLFEFAKALIFINILLHLFLKPFMQGFLEGAGSDYGAKKRAEHSEKIKASKSTGITKASDHY